MADLTKFKKILYSKCEKEHENFDKKYEKINTFKQMKKEDYIFALQDVQAFKNEFLIPHYKMYNLLEVFNQEISNLRKKRIIRRRITISNK